MNEAASRRHECLADRRGKLLTTAAELREWLMVEGFRARRASRAELASVRELHACLHVLVVANAHRSTDDGALRSLTLQAEKRPVRFTFASSAISSATSSATPSVMSRSKRKPRPVVPRRRCGDRHDPVDRRLGDGGGNMATAQGLRALRVGRL